MLSKRTFTCIVCPNGCTIETVCADGAVKSVTGQKCKRGEEYVTQELIDPRRTIATTVKVHGAPWPLCSVRLNRAIPKKDIFRVMDAINKVELQAPVHIGQVVIANVCGLDSDVIATKELPAKE